MRHNEDAALNAARYQMKQEQEPMPADEYAQATGMASVTEPKTPLQIYAQDEAWEVANSVLDEAFAKGDFDNLALAGQKIDHITNNDDPDWWLKSMMRREQLTGLGPPALTLRVEDEHMAEVLDQLPTSAAVRAHVEDFNARIKEARLQLLGGPPVITPLRDASTEVLAWQQRRASTPGPAPDAPKKKRWWRR
ncbi:J-domain-containing protein [Glutamicibacter sp. MCAF14]|uniref:DnaJ family domain-containing protein n=1 Tax=Glutamicibacter sp. MCAF14 TaxID=3233043 RepID=UPI003F8FDD6F